MKIFWRTKSRFFIEGLKRKVGKLIRIKIYLTHNLTKVGKTRNGL